MDNEYKVIDSHCHIFPEKLAEKAVSVLKSGYRIIDSHCHIYPEKIAEKAVAGTDGFYDWVSVGKGTSNELLTGSVAENVDLFIVQSVATTAKQVRSINEFIAVDVEKSNGKFIGLGTLYPDSPDLVSDFEHLKSLGLRGVKLHPDIQQFKIDDYRCLKIYELCERDGLPILMHTGDSRYDFSNPNRLIPVLKIYTGLTVIGAHFGGWSIWEEASRQLCDIPNLYVDCSSSLPHISKETAVEIIRRYGADKVLFGSDYPMWLPDKEIESVLSLGLTDEELKKIFSGNAKKIFNI